MNISPDKTLALVEVTRLIFRTKSPSEVQVARIQKLMQLGALSDCHCAGPPAQWTTTAAAIADYLAKESLKRQAAKHANATGEAPPVPSLFDGSVPEPESATQLKSLYKGIWSDYFLTVFMQRKAAHQSVNFRRAVLAGQIFLLLTILMAMLGGVSLTFESVPPQHALVENWIEQNTDYYTIQNWHPLQPAPKGEGVLLRVQYTYRGESSSRPVTTDRTFLIAGDQVSEFYPSP